MSTQQIPDFQYKAEEYAIHNARPNTVEFVWGGYRFDVPPVDGVGPNPAHFVDGAPVPGSLVIRDSYQIPYDRDGMAALNAQERGPHTWKAKEALRAVLGVGPGGEATSQLAKNGVSYLPVVVSREEYQKIREAGEARYRESLIGWAIDTVQNYEEARNKAKQAGVDGKPPGRDFYQAQAILQAHQSKVVAGFEASSVAAAAGDDDLDFMIYAKAKALQLAGPIAEQQSVDKAKLVESLLQDPGVMANLRKKYSVRKRGYLDPETASPGAELPPEDEVVRKSRIELPTAPTLPGEAKSEGT